MGRTDVLKQEGRHLEEVSVVGLVVAKEAVWISRDIIRAGARRHQPKSPGWPMQVEQTTPAYLTLSDASAVVRDSAELLPTCLSEGLHCYCLHTYTSFIAQMARHNMPLHSKLTLWKRGGKHHHARLRLRFRRPWRHVDGVRLLEWHAAFCD